MTTKIVAHTPILPNSGKASLNWAGKRNVKIIDPSDKTSAAEFNHAIDGAIAIVDTRVTNNAGGWSDELVSGLPSSVKAVCNYGAGYDGLGSLDRFKTKGVQVCNTPHGVAQATADTGLYSILGSLRNFGECASSLRQGHWNRNIPLGEEYDDKTLGISGLGGIGSLVRDKVVAAFNFDRILYHNRHRAPPEVEKDSEYVSFDDLLAQSDVILTVLPSNAGTRHLINREAFGKMKRGVILVNIGRGPIIDEEALVEALESGQVHSVGLDVYEHEPEIHPKLLASKNTLLLPHVGTHTLPARVKMLNEIIDNLNSLLDKGKVIDSVPELR